jgi:hypothetical protein
MIAGPTDVDYYAVNVSEASVLALNFSTARFDVFSLWNVSWLDSSGNYLQNSVVSIADNVTVFSVASSGSSTLIVSGFGSAPAPLSTFMRIWWRGDDLVVNSVRRPIP